MVLSEATNPWRRCAGAERRTPRTLLVAAMTMSVLVGAGGAALADRPAHAGAHQQAFDLEGHRGTRGLRPENTLPAFGKALDIGVRTLELDTAITKDRVVVVSHERLSRRWCAPTRRR